jgi:alcohol dehydrogenase
MKGAIYHKYGGEIIIDDLPDPTPSPHGVVIRVRATGICRSDWYGWQGNDSDIVLPHVPGHELAGEVVEVGKHVKLWKKGDRVTVPFVGGCGHCPECKSGNQQVCDHQFQPGFTAWGSFAEYVAIDYADINLVKLPESIDFVTAASLGCRFITAFRGVVDLGDLQEGQWIAIHGCGGVGLSAILIARALDAKIIAVDIDDDVLAFAKSCGADFTINAMEQKDIPLAIKDISSRGVHVSIDALGNKQTCTNSILSLKKRGRHIQIGLLEKGETRVAIPMDKVIANELQILGSHGMQAHRYPAIWKLTDSGSIDPGKLVTDVVTLSEGIHILTHMDTQPPRGVAVIDRFI